MHKLIAVLKTMALIGFLRGGQMQENGWHALVPTRVMQAESGKCFTPEQWLKTISSMCYLENKSNV
jgi:hypothetical protein